MGGGMMRGRMGGMGMMGGGMGGMGMMGMMSMAHPIHLHGQQFQIIERSFEATTTTPTPRSATASLTAA